MNFKEYFKCKQDTPGRWLEDEGNSPFNISGYDTDIRQLVACLTERVKYVYPINSVPKPVMEMLNYLSTVAESFESFYEKLVDYVAVDMDTQHKRDKGIENG
jgi:hypothetical protein